MNKIPESFFFFFKSGKDFKDYLFNLQLSCSTDPECLNDLSEIVI